ncbi:excisionase [Serratia sp. T13T92]
MTKLLTLEEWADEVYTDKSRPTVPTLQRWARNGNIYPTPDKQGRQYFVKPGAIYINPNDLNLGKKIRDAQSAEPARAAFMEKVINGTAKGRV